MKIQVRVLTPEKEIYKDEADEVIIPTTAGVIGVLPNHAPLVGQIAAGEILIKNGDKNTPLAVYGGYVEVNKAGVTILAEYAVHVDDIDLAKVQEAKERAEKVMKEKLSEEELTNIEAELRKAITQIHVARKYRPKN